MIALDHQGMSHSKSQLPISFLRLKDSKLALNIGDVFDSSSHYHYSFFADLINETLPNSFILKSENIREITCMALSQPLLVRFSFKFFC